MFLYAAVYMYIYISIFPRYRVYRLYRPRYDVLVPYTVQDVVISNIKLLKLLYHIYLVSTIHRFRR